VVHYFDSMQRAVLLPFACETALRHAWVPKLMVRACVCMQVFVTCGTPEKRAFLLAAFPALDAGHIGDSRSCAFEALVARQTRGAGVHLALNSLANDKLQARAPALIKCWARHVTSLYSRAFLGSPLPDDRLQARTRLNSLLSHHVTSLSFR
jgi:hypothetical protein